MASEILKSSGTLQRLAENNILVVESDGLRTYLAKHSQLSQLLPKICGDIRRTLGPEVELCLELYSDPEIDDRYLTLYARKDKYEPDILDTLQTVSDRFNATLEEVPGYFLLTTDFSVPRGGQPAHNGLRF